MGSTEYQDWSREELLAEVEALRAQLACAGPGAETAEGAYGVMARQAMLGLMLVQGNPLRVLFANQAMSDIFGRSVKELQSLTAENLTALVHPDDRERVFSRLAQRLAGDTMNPRTEFRILLPDGAIAWVLADSRQTEFKGAPALLTTFLDVSDMKRAVEALRQSEEKDPTLLHTSPDAVIVLDGAGRIAEVSERAAALFGLTGEDDLLGRHGLELLAPDDQDAGRQAMVRAATQGASRAVEYTIPQPDGSRRVGEVNATMLRDGAGSPSGFIVTIRDVTERKKDEEVLRALNETLEARVAERTNALEEQTQLIRTILDSMAEGVIVVEPGPRVILVNRAAQAMFDVPPEVMTDPARVEQDVFRPDTASAYSVDDTPMVRATRGEVVDDEEIFIKPGGRDPGFWIAVTARPILSEQGVVSGAVAVIRDITMQKELETELRQSQKLEAVGRLAGGVAHDFNNLLTAITGHAERLLTLLEAEGERKKVAGILSAGERGEKLVQQLLAFSRKQPVEAEVLDLDSVVDESRNVLNWLVGEDVKVSIRLGASGGRVFVDRGQLDQVLANLALNGRDAMPQGGELRVETECVTVGEAEASRHALVAPGDYVRLEVRDSGTGIDPDILERIFEPFFTTKEVGKGTGLGLSTVYGIIKEAGGHIDVDSDPTMGTSFRIHLPQVEEPATAE